MKLWLRRKIKKLKLLFVRRGSNEERWLKRAKRRLDITTEKHTIRTDLIIGDRLNEISLTPKDREILYRYNPSYNELIRLTRTYRGLKESDHPSVNTKSFSTRH